MDETPSPRRKMRRAMYARHRNNVVACYNRLRDVLPQQNAAKEGTSQPDTINRTLSSSAIKYNRVTMVNRAKLYTLHLEEVLSSLLKKLNSQDEASETPLKTSDIDRNFKSLGDVHHNFLRNYDINKPIEQFEFECMEPMPEPLPHTQTLPFQNMQDQVNSSAEGSSIFQHFGHIVPTAILIPINFSPGNPIPCILEAYPPSPASHSIDLGFVSAGNASQDTVGSEK